jgi:serine protease Do
MSALLSAPAASVRGTSTAAGRTGAIRGMFGIAALPLTMLGIVLGVPIAHADSQMEIDQHVKQSLVYISTEYSGQVYVPASAATDGHGFWSKIIKADFSCSGVIVDPAGYIATAGHCVDPNAQDVRETILTQLYLNSGEDVNAATSDAHTAFVNEWLIEGQQPGAPIDRSVEVIQPEGPGRVIDHFVTAQVVDFQKFDDGDNALIKVANQAALPAMPVAEKAPVPGTGLTSAGFPGNIGENMDPSRLQEPSFKDGTASSQQVTPSGAARTEISAAISGGMSGGPTVDNSTGQVVGLNDFTISGENQPFNFVTDAAALRAFLVKNSVQLVTPTAPAKPFPWMWIGIAGAVVLVLLAVPVVLVVRSRAKKRSVPPIDGSQLLQPMTSPQPAPGPIPAAVQPAGGTSAPTREQRGQFPQAQSLPPVSAAPEPHAGNHDHNHAA